MTWKSVNKKALIDASKSDSHLQKVFDNLNFCAKNQIISERSDLYLGFWFEFSRKKINLVKVVRFKFFWGLIEVDGGDW